MSDISWDLHRTFLEVYRRQSLSGAARHLGLTQPTVGRHIDLLESALGTTLFTRSVNGLLPTSAADAVVPHAEAMRAAADALGRDAHRATHTTGGTIRIAASEVMGIEVLPALLAPLQNEHPDVIIELVLSNRMENLQRRDADLAVRMQRPSQNTLTARKIGEVAIGMFATRDYLDRHGHPLTIKDLQNHRVIGFDRDDLSVRAVTGSALPISRADFSFRSDSDLAQLAAIRAGMCLGGMQVPLARRQHNLIRVLPEPLHFSLEVWLATHPDLRAIPLVRLVADHLAGSLRTYLRESAEPA